MTKLKKDLQPPDPFVAQRYYELARYTHDAIFTLTTKGFVTSVNEAFNSLSGWGRQDWIGKHFKHFVNASDYRKATHIFRGALSEGQTDSIKIRMKSRHAGDVWVQMVLIPIFQGHQVQEIMGVMQKAAVSESLGSRPGQNGAKNCEAYSAEILKYLGDNISELSKEHKILLPVVDGLLYISCSEILFCEGSSNYTKIHTEDGKKYLVSKTLQQYEKLLSIRNFYRIHNSYLVNLLAIKKYVKGEGGYVILKNGSELNVSKRRRSAFLARLGVKNREYTE